MPGITLMTGFGVKDDTVGVGKRVSGEICPATKFHLSLVTQWFYGC